MTPAVAIPEAPAPLRILLVEDDLDDQYLFCAAAQKSRLNLWIFAVPHGQEAADYLQGTPPFNDRLLYPLPEVVVLDLKMPVMDGFEFLHWLRASPEFGALRVVACSGSPHQTWQAKASALGADKYLAKAVGIGNWTAMVRQIWELARGAPLAPSLPKGIEPPATGPELSA